MISSSLRRGLAAVAFASVLMLQTSSYSQTDSKPGEPFVINDLSSNLQFSYLSWRDKVTAGDGHLILKDMKCDGGGGFNKPLDLSAHANKSPALKLRTKPGNTAKTIKLLCSVENGYSGHWEFTLPSPSDEFVVVTPKWGASLSVPNTLEDNKNPENPRALDLAHITQYQLVGNWSKDTLNAEIDAIMLVEPDAAMLAQREEGKKQQAKEAEEKAKKAAEEKAKLAKEREQLLKSIGYCTPVSPEVVHVSLVAPDIMSLTIEAQKIKLPVLSKYEAKPGDVKKEEKYPDGVVRRAALTRDGKPVGWLQGKNLDWLTTYEGSEGHPLLTFLADEAANYTITSKDDPAYANGVKPATVHRKSLPIDWQQSGGLAFPMRHRIYLKLPSKIQPGKEYQISTEKINLKNPKVAFKADLQNVRSEIVHVNQIGYRPDDPDKQAFLSLWMGTGGAYKFQDGLKFSIIDEANGNSVFSGNVVQLLDVDGKEKYGVSQQNNSSRTAVYGMDFSSFKTPGKYRIFIDGIGCSYPFEISKTAWEKAFLIQMRGLLNNRSGPELGPPYTDFKKPADFMLEAGTVITRTKYDALANGNESFPNIVKEDTGETVTNAWGGYHDAGDWNPRKATHMKTTLAQLELVELYPEYFNSLNLRIPKMEGIPDMITEALFEIDCFRRMQLPDGGIPYGIETNGDPSPGEISWLTNQHAYVLAPNIRDSWLYAAVAARAAKVLKPFKPDLAKTYLDSAIKAFDWAEADYAKRKADGSAAKFEELWMAIDFRNLSSLVLYDILGDKKYHEIFKIDTLLNTPNADYYIWGKAVQCNPVFLYARLDDAKADPDLKKKAIAAVLSQAEVSMNFASGNVYKVTNVEKARPLFCGFFTTSGGTELARAHYLTGKPEYLKATLQSCLFQSGCNPNNVVYTTGLGANPVKNPLHLDSRSSGQPFPEGFTVFGNLDYWQWKGGFWDWPISLYLKKPDNCWPNPYDWPLTEAFFDIHMYVSMDEFVVDTWAPNVFVWGYLAVRPEGK
ncbi:MAG TPA: hypothetical protein DET40_11710 [Lentisphaeria bacterium]|nr:MAG: hypothetical protein A2X45_12585 [Lentisphaerae bacterium GWF2_50_93]HCE44204.1 hypothetical protein [Lentisphaeria bacterium]